MQKKLIIVFLLASLFSFSYFVYSEHPPGSNVTFPRDQIERDLALIKKSQLYNFEVLSLPGELEVKAGENVTLNFSIVNRGLYGLYEFAVKLSGVDFPYEITPNKTDIRPWGEWNPVDGQKRGEQKYQLTLNAPSNAAGVHLVDVTGTENFSWRKFSQSTQFILKVIPVVSVESNITISKISAPVTIKENEPFDIKFSVTNLDAFRQQIDLLLNIPADWNVVDTSKRALLLAPNETSNVTFTIVPTNTSGNISVNVIYPFKKTIFSFVKEGSALSPVVQKPIEPAPKRATGIAGLVEFLRNLSPIFLAILVLIVIIVVWFAVKLVKFYSARKKPEA